jgi:vanillate O-demethylase monooxygenase subunit
VPAVEHKNESIAAVFESDSFIVSPFFAPFVRDPNKAVSQRHMFRWDPPSSVWIAGDIDQEGSPHLQLRALHALTPETETSTHYWFCAARNFADNGPAGKTAASEAAMRIFATEDKPMLEGVQACMGGREFWDMNPAILQGDNVAVLARRSLRKMIQAEQKDSPCPAP